MANAKEQAEFVKNMDKLDKILTGPKAMSATDICKTYAKVKPILEAVLPILEKIPVLGKIVSAIRLLMTIADSFCKTT